MRDWLKAITSRAYSFTSIVLVAVLATAFGAFALAAFPFFSSSTNRYCLQKYPNFTDFFPRRVCEQERQADEDQASERQRQADRERAAKAAEEFREELAHECIAKDVARMENLADKARKAISPEMTLEAINLALTKILGPGGEILASNQNIKQRVYVTSIRTKCESKFHFLINAVADESGKLRVINFWAETAPKGYRSGLDDRYSTNFEMQQMNDAKEAARLAIKQREEAVFRSVSIAQRTARCGRSYKQDCRDVEFSIAVTNSSRETLEGVGFGWAFPLAAVDKCPSEFVEKKAIKTKIGPGETAWVVFDATDGPPSKENLIYCVALTSAKLQWDTVSYR